MTGRDQPRWKVLIVEDHAGVRGLVSALLEDVPGVEVVDALADGARVPEVLEQTGADTVVLDLGLPGVDGEELLVALRERHPEVRVVVLSGQASALVAGRIRAEGAAAVVEKGVSGWEGELIGAITDRARPG